MLPSTRQIHFHSTRWLSALVTLIASTSISAGPVNTDYDFIASEDGTYIWYIDERARINNGVLYTSYVKIDGHTGLSTLNLESGSRIGDDIDLSSFQQADDHNNAAILPLKNGKMMSLYTLHDARRTQYYRVSNTPLPLTLEDWGEEKTYPIPSSATYNNAYQLSAENNRVYNFFRVGARDPYYVTFDSNGENPSEAKHFIQNGTQWWDRAYAKYASNGVDRIDVFFTDGHPTVSRTSLYHMYIKGGNVYKSDNTRIGSLQDAPFGKNDATFVYQYGEDGTSRRPWNHEMRYGSDGIPVLFYSHQLDENTIDYYTAIWDSTSGSWIKKWVADAGDALIRAPMYAPDGTKYGGTQNDYAGGITLNPYNLNEIFISANVDPRNGQETTNYEIYKGTTTNNGDSYQWEAVTSDSPDNNYRPFVPFGANKPSEQVVVWFTGKYEQFTNGYRNLQSTGEPYFFKGYDSKVVGKYINRNASYLASTCQAVTITPNASNTTGYGGNQDQGSASFDNNGITVSGNGWKAVDIDYRVTPNTTLSFEFKSETQGEEHAIGLDNNLALSNGKRIRLYGTQKDAGIEGRFDTYHSDGGFERFITPIGKFIANSPYSAGHLVVNADDDANATGTSTFRNISLFEDHSEIYFSRNQVDNYDANQGDGGTFDVTPDGSTLTLTDNGWRVVELPYDITPSTVLTFDFKSTRLGEFHGIAMDGDSSLNNGETRFALYGTQADPSSNENYKTYGGSGEFQHFTIPVGQHAASGRTNYLVFIADHDGGTKNGESIFRNVRVFDDTNGNLIDDRCDPAL
ncbi:BNR repeat-containing protein [Enterovibrio sp. ZSDZ35]|uniref:BNR repeat-containing protein n=1 Tax=Enterovibrio qingdaonensis TaxID=2899818 RepID=A0ABT5QT04_9GAMM|nr:BNR-4 repeat-containing protein [Enterovibrio sp. ZSDZ35]MDD1783630.1 BNR repeat-containing protein [Enterovibrio sp. ZSDZ35]